MWFEKTIFTALNEEWINEMDSVHNGPGRPEDIFAGFVR
jgi:hypothetical protein